MRRPASSSSARGGTPPLGDAWSYDVDFATDACDALFASWRAFARVLSAPEQDLATSLLCLPGIAPDAAAAAAGATAPGGDDRDDVGVGLARFAAFSELVSRQARASLSLAPCVFGVVAPAHGGCAAGVAIRGEKIIAKKAARARARSAVHSSSQNAVRKHLCVVLQWVIARDPPPGRRHKTRSRNG